MDTLDTKVETLNKAFTELRRTIRHAKEQAIAGLSFSRTQLEVLHVLAEAEGATTGELAAMLFLTAGAVTQTMETLVKRDLVERRHDTQDRRVIHHQLTPHGRQVIEELHAAQHRRLKAFVATLDQTELDEMTRAMQRVKVFIDEGLKNEQQKETLI